MSEIFIEITQINYGSAKWNELIEFAKTCSWRGTGQYFAELLEGNEFEDSEKIFVAFHDEEIAGFVALVNESCVEDVGYAPWLDFLFVSEKFRHKGIAKMLIDHVLQTAAKEELRNVYLCTVSHKEMYAKSGFEVIDKTAINGGDECCVMRARTALKD